MVFSAGGEWLVDITTFAGVSVLLLPDCKRGELMIIKQKNDKNKYSVLNINCLGCTCLTLGLYQHRGATSSGSRNTGDYSACCMTRAYHGCPDVEKRGYSVELLKQRKSEGMKVG